MLKNNLRTKIKLSNNFTIANSSKCFIVAEISANHSGSLNILKKTMIAAKKLEQTQSKFKHMKLTR